MKQSILQQAMSPEVLNLSWRRLKIEHTPWSPTVSRDLLQSHLLKYILESREQVLDGRYSPQSLRQFPLKKPDGRQRIISAQYLQDKLIQRAVLTVLEPRAEAMFHDDSYAYRPKRSVDMAMAKVRERIRIGQDWLVDADITSFFDNIPHRILIKILKQFVSDKQAMLLIEKWLKAGAHQSSLLGTRKGISQGAILSPLFCNLYLHQFDIALTRANIPFVRFADDFLLFTNSESNALRAKDFAEQRLNQLGLELHPLKTCVARSSPKLVFLGKKLPKPSE
ncbi:reverse transcriptase domain-containing protein [Leucothrix pacifica]|uniref:Retron-type reverse transcriptase n=1 Tax=Leucothrix pacifica TaxID=1247513 RepID=A0A317CHW8_9GAMM|nr:reverse transcriptase domain-containing protein [Leucothrix pacifica]PWQ98148.1 Retron-type reverse transcriptase [Leucothrix pacifica]